MTFQILSQPIPRSKPFSARMKCVNITSMKPKNEARQEFSKYYLEISKKSMQAEVTWCSKSTATQAKRNTSLIAPFTITMEERQLRVVLQLVEPLPQTSGFLTPTAVQVRPNEPLLIGTCSLLSLISCLITIVRNRWDYWSRELQSSALQVDQVKYCQSQSLPEIILSHLRNDKEVQTTKKLQ